MYQHLKKTFSVLILTDMYLVLLMRITMLQKSSGPLLRIENKIVLVLTYSLY